MDANYQFFMKANLEQYLGEWIAICAQQIVAHGKDVQWVFHEAKRKFPNKHSLVARVPNPLVTFYSSQEVI